MQLGDVIASVSEAIQRLVIAASSRHCGLDPQPPAHMTQTQGVAGQARNDGTRYRNDGVKYRNDGWAFFLVWIYENWQNYTKTS